MSKQIPPEMQTTQDAPVAKEREVGSRLREERVIASVLGRPMKSVKLDRYVLLHPIGAGGMGEIFAAYDDRLDRKVALKLVRSGVARSARANERLLREAQALARLSHPNVVQVYEAGNFQGDVFIAMEFVRGQTLREWLRDTAITDPSRERQSEILRQFIDAGRGLQAAHEAGLAHRDFKPENVILADDGRPRVVDFGLARAIQLPMSIDESDTLDVSDDDLDGSGDGSEDDNSSVPESGNTLDVDDELESPPKLKAAITTVGRIMGTVPYMSPEQMRGELADSRSDQFSFCVALYEALYNQRPFPGRSAKEIYKLKDQGDVQPPPRGSQVPVIIRKALLRGLSPDPKARFASMAELLNVLERWESWPKRRRRRWALAAAAALTLAGSTAAHFSLLTPPNPCALADQEMDASWTPERTTGIRASFAKTGLPFAEASQRLTIAQLDLYADAWKRERMDACRDTHIAHTQSEELLDRRVICLDRGRNQLAALLGQLERADAAVVVRAADAVMSLPRVEECNNTESLVLGVAPPKAAQAVQVAAVREQLALSQTQHLLGFHHESLATARQALEQSESIAYSPLHAEALFRVGQAMVHRGGLAADIIARGTEAGAGDGVISAGIAGDVAKGEAMLQRASNIAEGERHDQLVAEIWNTLLMSAYLNHSNATLGHAWTERAFAAIRRAGDEPRSLAEALRRRGLLFFKEGRFAEAEADQRQAIALTAGDPGYMIVRRVFQLQELANTVRARGRLREAEELYNEALALVTGTMGGKHPRTADILFDLARLEVETGRLESAFEHMEVVLQIYRHAFQDHHPHIGKAALELADIERQRGNLNEAFHHADEGRRIYERAYPANHIKQMYVYTRLAAIAFQRSELDDALSAYQRVLAIQTQYLDDANFEVGVTHANIGEVYVKLGRYDQAITALDRAQLILTPYAKTHAVVYAFVQGMRGQVLFGEGDLDGAITALDEAVKLFADHPGDPLNRADAYWALARALRAKKGNDLGRAETLAREALSIYERSGEAGSSISSTIKTWLQSKKSQ